eukprot:8807413-Ditylum_brightwellii.AAC.1
MTTDHLGEIPEMVKSFCLDTSDKYVFKPSKSQITEDILLGLKIFKNLVKWKEFWCLKALNNKTTFLTKEEDIDAKQGEDFESVWKKEGLEEHLEKNVEAILQQEVVKIHHAAELLAKDLKEELSTGEMGFLNEGIASKAIPQPQLL